eukprot:m.148245 g.148245  ORF g.148245 m.148245 type:complete len:83 (-) comp16277_c1_seq1:1338-1586(-)
MIKFGLVILLKHLFASVGSSSTCFPVHASCQGQVNCMSEQPSSYIRIKARRTILSLFACHAKGFWSCNPSIVSLMFNLTPKG